MTSSSPLHSLLEKVKQKTLAISAEAEIFLFGSRQRGDYHEESDVDILIVLPAADEHLIPQLRSVFYELELEFSQVISVIFLNRQKWQYEVTPFREQIKAKGLKL